MLFSNSPSHFRISLAIGLLSTVLAPAMTHAQTGTQALTWEQVKAKFETVNPALRADQMGVDELKAAEITLDATLL